MRKKHIITIGAFAVVGLGLCVIMARFMNKEVNKVRLHSANEALLPSLIVELDSYYGKNDQYPESLNELTEIEYADGATPEMLKNFIYIQWKYL